ncbi:MAG: hypothetical protein OES32_02015 [Acidobacteriota bacterium]|nr:hypothetical protein [Acidobacteriota bacterium]MDH3522336.1 hypothetical protein [Acidobacteriota bacterium]
MKTPHNPTVSTLAMTALILGLAGPAAQARDDGEIPFSVSEIYFELNDTDGDLGIHSLIDGEPWKFLSIEGPDERQNLNIRVKSNLRRQGLTELFFESAEPPFDELPPEEFFGRFPEGVYEVEGLTLEGDELESETVVTHLMPAPVENFTVNGEELPEDCDEDPVPAVSEPFVIDWDPVTLSHPEIGRTDEPIEVVRYEVIAEREEPTLVKFTILLPPDVTEVELPAGLAKEGEEWKVEVLTREESGNQTATESCFEVGD